MKILTKNAETVIGIETASNVYYLREPRPIAEVTKFLEIIQNFEREFDMSQVETQFKEEEGEEWKSVNEIREFYEGKYNRTQGYFEVLAEKKDWISAKELLKAMAKRGFDNLVSQSISGIRAGNTKSYRNWEKEPLDESEWNGDEWQNYYRIRPKYFKLLRQALKIEE